MKIRKFIIALVAVAIVGCASKPELKPVVEVLTTKNIVTLIAPPSELVKNCVIDSPPNKTDYLAGNDQDKEQFLMDYTKKLLVSLKLCNKDINILRSWIKDQIEINTPTQQ